MSKILIFSFLWYILGNPFLALLVLLVIFYAIDRRYVGLFPSLVRPFRVSRRISALRSELRMSPHNTSAKHELARLLMEKKQYRQALSLLEEVQPRLEDSDDVLAELGICRLKLGDLEVGEQLIMQSVERSPRVKYGEPFLQLGEAFAGANPDKAVRYLERFKDIHTSSCKGYYRLGQLYTIMGRKEDAKAAFRETVEIYRSLPKYKRKTERRWFLLALFKKGN